MRISDWSSDVCSSDLLATEVLAACLAGHQAFLESEAEAGIASRHPVRAARALMILGFGYQSPVADAELERFRNRNGLVGQAAKDARFAYERNNWSRICYDRLVEADDVVAFWGRSHSTAINVDRH